MQALAIAAAVTFVWLGMVLAISFLEAPLKFRAPGVTTRIGLGIGRLVFRALNTVEAVLATVLLSVLAVETAVVSSLPPSGAVTPAAVAILTLAAQLAVVRPRLARGSDRILAGRDAPRSKGHYVYVALEVVKVVALFVAGVTLLMS
ncbi:hypothetical protein AB0G15_11410 [Streptosporangium sp. NPDC023825]|uniref:hypothetical protein n=1 Tax=Streptosporangium sp. NPDC023825 TaxID=3154909 RepID=UPI0034274D56